MTCPGCGAEFTPGARNAPRRRYCTPACQKAAWARERYANDPEYRQLKSDRNQEYQASLTGVAYHRRRLKVRRNMAMLRRRQRSLRATPS